MYGLDHGCPATPDPTGPCAIGLNTEQLGPDRLHFRKGPSVDSDRIGGVDSSETYVVLDHRVIDGEDWYQIQYGSYQGWVLGRTKDGEEYVRIGGSNCDASVLSLTSPRQAAAATLQRYGCPEYISALDSMPDFMLLALANPSTPPCTRFGRMVAQANHEMTPPSLSELAPNTERLASECPQIKEQFTAFLERYYDDTCEPEPNNVDCDEEQNTGCESEADGNTCTPGENYNIVHAIDGMLAEGSACDIAQAILDGQVPPGVPLPQNYIPEVTVGICEQSITVERYHEILDMLVDLHFSHDFLAGSDQACVSIRQISLLGTLTEQQIHWFEFFRTHCNNSAEIALQRVFNAIVEGHDLSQPPDPSSQGYTDMCQRPFPESPISLDNPYPELESCEMDAYLNLFLLNHAPYLEAHDPEGLERLLNDPMPCMAMWNYVAKGLLPAPPLLPNPDDPPAPDAGPLQSGFANWRAYEVENFPPPTIPDVETLYETPSTTGQFSIPQIESTGVYIAQNADNDSTTLFMVGSDGLHEMHIEGLSEGRILWPTLIVDDQGELRLAFILVGDNVTLWQMNVTRNLPYRVLTTAPGRQIDVHSRISWAPDGSILVTLIDEDGVPSIYAVKRIDFPGDPLITNAANPTWSPDWDIVAYQRETTEGHHIYVYSLSAPQEGNETPIDSDANSNDCTFPVFSYDASKIFFICTDANNRPEVHVHVIGGENEQLDLQGIDVQHLATGPLAGYLMLDDGRRIYMSDENGEHVTPYIELDGYDVLQMSWALAATSW